MKRIILMGATGLLFSLLTVHAAWAFGTKDVLQMHQDGIADSLIIQKIQYSGTTFHLDAGDLRALKRAGVPDDVVSAMLLTERRGASDRYWDGYYYYPPYPRVIVGLGFGYYGHYAPYYGGYWRRPYFYGHSGFYGRPAFGRPGFGRVPSGLGHRR
jgi:hypothetical protein